MRTNSCQSPILDKLDKSGLGFSSGFFRVFDSIDGINRKRDKDLKNILTKSSYEDDFKSTAVLIRNSINYFKNKEE